VVPISSPAAEELGTRLARLGWITDLLVGGSLATGDYAPGISDLDLVALVDGPVDTTRQFVLTALHRDLDQGPGWGLKLGCVYVDAAQLLLLDSLHPPGLTARGRHTLATGTPT
jgi:hypothetical protein